LERLLWQNKPAIVKRWFELVAGTYPADTAKFLKQEGDRFLNPVGATFSEELDAIYQELLEGMNEERLSSRLSNIIKIRSVQDFPPSQAIGFVFLLKRAIREELRGIKEDNVLRELVEFDLKIDKLALLALDIYAECREKIYQLSLEQIRNEREMAFKLLERSTMRAGEGEEI